MRQKGISWAVSVNPLINLLEAQQSDPQLLKIIEIKNRGLPKPQIERTDDPNLKISHRHYDRLFVRDGFLVRSISNQP